MNIFKTLNAVNVNDWTEKKKGSGYKELTYLSWVHAWKAIKERYPEAVYEIKKFENNLPYLYDENTGYMVFTTVTIENLTHEMWLPVMDGSNKAMKSKSYEYTTKKGKRRVEQASMFDINKTIMRCLVKNLAMFGLGLYIYAGEDLPLDKEANIASAIDDNKEKIATEIRRSLYKKGKPRDIVPIICDEFMKYYSSVFEKVGKAENITATMVINEFGEVESKKNKVDTKTFWNMIFKLGEEQELVYWDNVGLKNELLNAGFQTNVG